MKPRIPEQIVPVLNEARKTLLELYTSRLKGMFLYGSYARGDYMDGSDIDVAILLDGAVTPMDELERYLPHISPIALKHDTVVSITVINSDYFKAARTPLILNIIREGIAIQ
ncbi:MAG TPA: nucleotidyltransferase domain-containing protein [Spirochaetota bacterium]|nr:nucleotidyltransferase domain-containing protein [Spirochaetota bacterium]HPU88673.1 nucleotidyltransferase domain-containing protein [Spirochaetota bacterium]